MTIDKKLLEATINDPAVDKNAQKAWLHDVLVLCNLMQPKRPNDYEFMYNTAETFSYVRKLKDYGKKLGDYITKHDCSNCELIDSILEYLSTIRFVGDVTMGELKSSADWKKVYNHRNPNLQFGIDEEAKTLAEFFRDTGLSWTCTKEQYKNINSKFFEYLKKYNCIKIV